jgi:acyl-homoserine lactone acylase PvdQ
MLPAGQGEEMAAWRRNRRGIRVAFLALVALCACSTGSAAGAVQPYGTHDARGFRNVLPPGEKGTDNAGDLTAYELSGGSTLPDHWIDQQPLYENLVYGEPTLTNGDIPKYFKDATFGVKAADVESTINPKPGVTIVRDSQYGIPHIYGDTRDDVMFGTGYANAQDRLFFMDVLRNTGRANLSSFAGGTDGNRAMDRNQWQLAPYTEHELREQVNRAGEFYGKAGERLVADVQSYVAGINQYISDAMADPVNKMPSEYAAFGQLPQPWKVTDVIATASLIGGIFGKGGGREVDSAKTLQALQRRFGHHNGEAAWSDFRAKNDPEAPTTILGRRFPYETTSSFAPRGLALPDPGSVRRVPVASSSLSRKSGGTSSFGDIGAQLRRAVDGTPHASNWELVAARHSRTGHPIGVLGPQVGYYVPQVLMEEDIHGGGLDARGATFPGVGLFILLGHGRDYAWSATTATADNVDTFAEVLCQDRFHYRYKGKCRAMRKLEHTNTWVTSGGYTGPPGQETLTAYRTVHGIVYARGTVHGRKVAFVSARSTYFHEADSALFFSRLNNPHQMQGGTKSFFRAAHDMNFAFNWSYIDDKHIAYHLTGWYPQRSRGTSPDFPVLGTGQYDWKGFNPRKHTADWTPDRRLPHTVDPGYLVSWNNKQAPGWAAADDEWAYGPLHRSQMIADKVRRGVSGGRKMTLARLVQAMDGPATQDLRALKLLPVVLRATGNPSNPALRNALGELRAWRRAGAHRRDLNKDGHYEHNKAVELMDAWWPKLVNAEFKPSLGSKAFGRVASMLSVGDHTRGAPNAPDFFSGWWGYVSKDLRDLFGPVPQDPYSRVYCGRGSAQRCRHALRSSLREALKVTPQDLYGQGDCSSDPEPSCYDQNRSTIASAIGEPAAFPFQNRPTFQQTVSLTHGVP